MAPSAKPPQHPVLWWPNQTSNPGRPEHHSLAPSSGLAAVATFLRGPCRVATLLTDFLSHIATPEVHSDLPHAAACITARTARNMVLVITWERDRAYHACRPNMVVSAGESALVPWLVELAHECTRVALSANIGRHWMACRATAHS